MVALSDPAWLQGAFNALVGLFYRVGLQTNVWKTVGMVCHPCQAAGNITQVAYRRRLTGEGNSYRKRQGIGWSVRSEVNSWRSAHCRVMP